VFLFAPAGAGAEAMAAPEPTRQGENQRRTWRRRILPALLRAQKAAQFCDVSEATWWRWDAAGRIPAGFKISPGVKHWRRAELRAWINAGCPDRKTWEAMRRAREGRCG
jgi:predicted DNA-binding transcriptional regulator AlpA